MAWRLHLLLVTQVVLLDGETTSKTSVVCIDSRMPLSAEKVAKVMLEEWRDLRDSWDYVEGSVDVIIPASSTVLVAVHACGILSDKAISLAIQGNSPLVFVPCCHTKKSLSQEQRRQMIYLPSVSSFSTPTSMTNLAEIIDKYRVQRLRLWSWCEKLFYNSRGDFQLLSTRFSVSNPLSQGGFENIRRQKSLIYWFQAEVENQIMIPYETFLTSIFRPQFAC